MQCCEHIFWRVGKHCDRCNTSGKPRTSHGNVTDQSPGFFVVLVLDLLASMVLVLDLLVLLVRVVSIVKMKPFSFQTP